MDYAVIKIQGHQEIVNAQTQNLTVDRLEAQIGVVVKPEVLLSSIDEKVQVGQPTVDFPIELRVVKHQRGEKLYIEKFHAKARYRRRTGFRAEQTVLKLIKFGTEKLEEKSVKSVKAEKSVKLSKSEKAVKAQPKKAPRKTTVKKASKRTSKK